MALVCARTALLDDLQDALPSAAQVAEAKALAEARDKLAKSLVGHIMDYKRNTAAQASACIQTLMLILGNVVQTPADAGKRSVR